MCWLAGVASGVLACLLHFPFSYAQTTNQPPHFRIPFLFAPTRSSPPLGNTMPAVNMILTALERAAATGNGDKVSFEVSDCCKRDFPEGSFDVVISRDTLLHIGDKPTLFKR